MILSRDCATCGQPSFYEDSGPRQGVCVKCGGNALIHGRAGAPKRATRTYELVPDLFGSAAPLPVAPLLDATLARAARDEAIQRVEDGASVDWLSRALEAVRRVAGQRETLTTDDVAGLVPEPPEPKAWGPVMLAAARAGYIERTDRTRESDRVSNHRRPMRVWHSLICNKAAA